MEVFSIENEAVFIRCYRNMILSYRLSPERSEAQLSDILRRVRAAWDARKPAGAAFTAAGSLQEDRI